MFGVSFAFMDPAKGKPRVVAATPLKITAEDDSATSGFIGYGGPDDGAFGSKTGTEPFPDNELLVLGTTSGLGFITFDGDLTAILATKSITIGAQGPFAMSAADTIELSGGKTNVIWFTSPYTLVDAVEYGIVVS